jgi:drug/metabolite transporter (DMT)-like permease
VRASSAPARNLHPRPAVLWAAIVVGILAISSASILIRLADAPPLSIAAYRVTLAALVLGCARLGSKKSKTLERARSALAAAGLSGLFLAFHFAFWITSLTMTSIASSVTLVSTTPFFVALISSSYFRERLRPRFLAGILLTLIGSGLVAGVDSSLSGTAVRGDLLSIAGAIMAAGYLIAGKVARRSLSLSGYALGSYGTAAVILLALCFFSNQALFGFSVKTYTALCLLALVPQLVGHTTFNWTLKFLSPATVSVLILGEPIGATILGCFILGETVDFPKAAGLFILGVGIFLCALCAPNEQPGESPTSTIQPQCER